MERGGKTTRNNNDIKLQETIYPLRSSLLCSANLVGVEAGLKVVEIRRKSRCVRRTLGQETSENYSKGDNHTLIYAGLRKIKMVKWCKVLLLEEEEQEVRQSRSRWIRWVVNQKSFAILNSEVGPISPISPTKNTVQGLLQSGFQALSIISVLTFLLDDIRDMKFIYRYVLVMKGYF